QSADGAGVCSGGALLDIRAVDTDLDRAVLARPDYERPRRHGGNCRIPGRSDGVGFHGLRAALVPPKEESEYGDRYEPETEAARRAPPSGGGHQEASPTCAPASAICESALDTDRTRRSNSSRASITRRPQDSHRSPMSAP